MYYCNNCGEFTPAVLSNDTFQGVCAYCYSEDIELADKCGICGKPIQSKNDYCEECEDTANKYINDLAECMGINREKALDLFAYVYTKEREQIK